MTVDDLKTWQFWAFVCFATPILTLIVLTAMGKVKLSKARPIDKKAP